ncbi:MAG: hypothetical protein ACYDEW_00510 [Vulcanimicrobiaceae bacterium]
MMRLALLAAFIAAAVPAGGAHASERRFTRDGAVIRNSGSTNFLGYTVKVWSDGQVWASATGRDGAPVGRPRTARAGTELVERFFADVQAARDGHATGTPCMKSASFGSTTTVLWHEWTSPDLSCPGGDRLTRVLRSDVLGIESAAGVSTLTRGTVRLPINEPRRKPSEVPPASASPSPRTVDAGTASKEAAPSPNSPLHEE